MSLRRPDILRFSNSMAEYVDDLESSPCAAPTDKRLAAWVKIQSIMDECRVRFALDSSSGSVSLTDPRIQVVLSRFEKQLRLWESSLVPGTSNRKSRSSSDLHWHTKRPKACLKINYHVNNIYLHEIVLHLDHHMDDFRPPFWLRSSRLKSKPQQSLNSAYVDATIECLDSAHSVLETFLRMEVQNLREIPSLTFVRVVYSLVILIKMSFSAGDPMSCGGRVSDCNNIRVGYYLDTVHAHLLNAADGEKASRAVCKFSFVLRTLRAWYQRQGVRLDSKTTCDELLEPLMHLTINPKDDDCLLQSSSMSSLESTASSDPYSHRTIYRPNRWTEIPSELTLQPPNKDKGVPYDQMQFPLTGIQRFSPPLTTNSVNFLMNTEPLYPIQTEEPAIDLEGLMMDKEFFGCEEYAEMFGLFDWPGGVGPY